MKALKERTSIILDEDVLKRIKELAEEDDCSFSQYVNLVLKRHIKEMDDRAEKK